MRYAGIDLGSRTICLVVVDGAGDLVLADQADTGFDPMPAAENLIHGVAFDAVLATGYGRNLLEIAWDTPTVTEIKAHALGARASFPEAGTVLDIGGQDSKAISLFDDGRVRKFEMNDRCAAGTGKFLEIMAGALGFGIDEFGPAALRAAHELKISSMCTVFAESEVTSLISRGADRCEIARGLHASVVRRAVGMIKRVSDKGPIVFTGGVARNPCIGRLLQEGLGREILVGRQPQMTGALGAALLARDF
jgi:predicted CoA-substrate-specific enzyme activase